MDLGAHRVGSEVLFPLARCEFGDAAGRMFANPLQYINEIGIRIDAVEPAQRLATGMAKEDIVGFLAALASAAEPVDIHFMWRPQLADPADELVLEAAVNGRASAAQCPRLFAGST